MKRKSILSILLALILSLSLTLPALAAAPRLPARNPVVDSITVNVPEYPALSITFTDVGQYVGEIAGGGAPQTKFYCTSDTTVSFSHEMFISFGLDGEKQWFGANEVFKPMSLYVVNGSPWSVGNRVIVAKDGTLTFTTDQHVFTRNGEKVFKLDFSPIVYYSGNIKEGYTMTDLTAWEAEPTGTLELAKTYPDDTPSYSWYLPFIGREQVTMAGINKFYEPATDTEAEIDGLSIIYGGVAGKTLTAYTVKIGEKIYTEGASGFTMERLGMVDGKLQTAGVARLNLYVDLKLEYKVIWMPAGADEWYSVDIEGSYLSFLKEGYYIMEILPWNKYCLITDPSSPYFWQLNENNVFRYGYAVVHVVK